MSPQEFDQVMESIATRHNGKPVLSNGRLDSRFDRRDFLKGMGVMIVSVSIAGTADALTKSDAVLSECPLDAEAALAAKTLADPDKNKVDSWIAIGQDNSVTFFTSRVQFGPGTCTGQMQVLADALDVSLDRIRLVSGDTAIVPETGVNAGSQSISAHGKAIH
ncbi:MAG: molybdopterin-dependent oxidoreductase, partial [Acidobacteria bacterium]|nr:molybdopterin-dependent oxidoreductase [Acidobacteriota bacterium]